MSSIGWLKSIDRLATRPAIALAKASQPLDRHFNLGKSTHHNTLLVRPGGMGDLILLQMAVETLGLDPHQMDWLIEKRSEPWASNSGLAFLCYDNPSHLKALARRRYSRVINSEQRFGLSAAFSVLLGTESDSLWGFSTNLGSRWSVPSQQTIPYDSSTTHELTEFRRLVAAGFGLKVDESPNLRRKRWSPPQSQVIAIGGVNSITRNFGAEQWISWANDWSVDGEIQIVFGPSDLQLATDVHHGLPRSKLVTGGFAASIQSIAQASRVLTVDGGLVHVCSYLGVPADVVFTAGIVRKWAPLSEESRVKVRKDLACQPCTVFGQVPTCPNELRCKDVEMLEWTEVADS